AGAEPAAGGGPARPRPGPGEEVPGVGGEAAEADRRAVHRRRPPAPAVPGGRPDPRHGGARPAGGDAGELRRIAPGLRPGPVALDGPAAGAVEAAGNAETGWRAGFGKCPAARLEKCASVGEPPA